MVAAVERWMSLNHEDRLAHAEEQSKLIMKPLLNVAGLEVELNNNIIGHQPFGVLISIDKEKIGISNEELVIKLKNHNPSIWTRIPEDEDKISIHVFGLNDGEAEIVGESIKKIISNLE